MKFTNNKIDGLQHKTAVRSYEQYIAEFPDSKMSKAEYEQKYLDGGKAAPGSSFPAIGPSKGQQSAPKFDPQKQPQGQKRPAHKVFSTLVNMARKPEFKGKMTNDSTQKILNSEGHKVTDFINHLFDGLKNNTTSFDDLAHFEDLGVITPDYTKRRLKINDMEGSVPPKFYDRYNIKHVDHYKTSTRKLLLLASILDLLAKNSER